MSLTDQSKAVIYRRLHINSSYLVSFLVHYLQAYPKYIWFSLYDNGVESYQNSGHFNVVWISFLAAVLFSMYTNSIWNRLLTVERSQTNSEGSSYGHVNDTISSTSVLEHGNSKPLPQGATKQAVTTSALEQHKAIRQRLDGMRYSSINAALTREARSIFRPLFLVQVNDRKYFRRRESPTDLWKPIGSSRDVGSPTICSGYLCSAFFSHSVEEMLSFDVVTALDLDFYGIGSQFEDKTYINYIAEVRVEDYI